MTEKNDMLKLIAVISMTIDHIGAVFFPQFLFLRLIGRISFPIFAYHIALGLKNTRHIGKYFFRLFLFALLTQPIYGALFSYNRCNIIVSLLCGGVIAWLLCAAAIWKNLLAVVGLLFVGRHPEIGYGVYGVMTIYGFSLFLDRPKLSCLYQLLLNGVLAIVTHGFLQSGAVFALPLIHKKWN